MELSIRDAVVADAPALAAIYGHYVLRSTWTFEETPPTAREMAARVADIQRQGLLWLVAEDRSRDPESAIAGYAYTRPYHERSAYRFTVENAVYLAENRTRQGIGFDLMQVLIARSAAAGLRQMIARIGTGDNAASVALHQKLGFIHTGRFNAIGFKFGKWLDVVEMQLPLGEGGSTLP